MLTRESPVVSHRARALTTSFACSSCRKALPAEETSGDALDGDGAGGDAGGARGGGARGDRDDGSTEATAVSALVIATVALCSIVVYALAPVVRHATRRSTYDGGGHYQLIS